MRPLICPHEQPFSYEGIGINNQAFRLGSAVGVQFHPEVTMADHLTVV